MCTALTLQIENGDILFGRTMDFSYVLTPEHIHVPTGTALISSTGNSSYPCLYSFHGTGQYLPNPVFADGVNDAGLAVAALYFPGYAAYDEVPFPPSSHLLRLAAFDVVAFVLGFCKNVEQAVSFLQDAQIVGIKDPITESISPLHWIMTDRSARCIVAEKTKEGLSIHENPIGVLTNSPDFSWHLTNLRNYKNVTSSQGTIATWTEDVTLSPFGQAAGTIGLPGDFTSPGRFVRTSWLLSHAKKPETKEEAFRTGFSILGNVTIPFGCVMTDRGTPDYTQYTILYSLRDSDYEIRS